MHLTPYFRRPLIILLFLSIPFLGKTRSLIKSNNNQLKLAEELIENGSINIAYLILDDYLKTPNLSKDKKYRIYKDIAKIYLYEQDLVNYE